MRLKNICSGFILLVGANQVLAGNAALSAPDGSTSDPPAGIAAKAKAPCTPDADGKAKAVTTGYVDTAPCAVDGTQVKVADVAQAAPAAAQEVPQGNPAESPAKEESVDQVIVTGSRIARPDFVSNQPIVSVSASSLAQAGKTNVESALEQTPQFANGQDENYNSNGPNGGRATLNLRGLGQSRTLVLLDGRRLAPTDGTGVANLDEIPQGIVGSIQVISGGASAAYG